MSNLAGALCGVCGDTIIGLRDGAYCPVCETPVHVACVPAESQTDSPDVCTRCGTKTARCVRPPGNAGQPSEEEPIIEGRPAASQGSMLLFRIKGTEVYVHWSWFLAAVYLFKYRPMRYSSMAWDVVEYVAGFAIVLIHELGHVIACRIVGGWANRIVLWPMGGLALVANPPRPGATLWTALGGPLTNLIAIPIFWVLRNQTAPTPQDPIPTDLHQLFVSLSWFNAIALIFNMLPVFPLDGGRTLYALLWWLVGRSASLAIASFIGSIVGIAIVVFAILHESWWFAAIGGFIALGALGGLIHSRFLARLAVAERRSDRACPVCATQAPIGNFWLCRRCAQWFDLFGIPEACPRGGGHRCQCHCFDCGRILTSSEWVSPKPASEGTS